MRESADNKATRYLTEGRVRPFRVNERGIAAKVVGDSGIYRAMLYDRSGVRVSECDCTNGLMRPGKATCAHTRALARLWPPIGG